MLHCEPALTECAPEHCVLWATVATRTRTPQPTHTYTHREIENWSEISLLLESSSQWPGKPYPLQYSLSHYTYYILCNLWPPLQYSGTHGPVCDHSWQSRPPQRVWVVSEGVSYSISELGEEHHNMGISYFLELNIDSKGTANNTVCIILCLASLQAHAAHSFYLIALIYKHNYATQN